MTKATKTKKLKAIRDEIVNLKQSPLYKYRTTNGYFPVIGEGDHDASIMFIGEAPGENEAKTARPFCGASGRILDELLASIQIDRSTVYITNIVKDRPQSNRDPSIEEIELYAPFLERQIEIIQPRVIATLGRFSMQFIMKRFGLEDKLESISNMHGKNFTSQMSYGQAHIVPLFHPAVALYNGSTKEILKKDFKQLKKLMTLK